MALSPTSSRPSGGSQAGATIVRGPYVVNAATADFVALANGVAFYTPTVGDVLLDAWFELDTTFDAAAAADISQYTGSGSPSGLFGYEVNPISLTGVADTIDHGGGPLTSSPAPRLMSLSQISAISAVNRLVPARFTTAAPLLLVVSQDGLKGGSTCFAAVGAARLYIVTATPAAFA